ncbi:hypothetical protein C8R41DRAFT_865924 [Lentinula lateritia]|uniref:Uncharacterized protein n=1 Tax=Lentinula lateritia TaxID=40482 RepID=A0ABQ8VK78_9AGAR|nr:hypothetical protein C8R41DRAFT_865924 [Lentinula lateritia]
MYNTISLAVIRKMNVEKVDRRYFSLDTYSSPTTGPVARGIDLIIMRLRRRKWHFEFSEGSLSFIAGNKGLRSNAHRETLLYLNILTVLKARTSSYTLRTWGISLKKLKWSTTTLGRTMQGVAVYQKEGHIPRIVGVYQDSICESNPNPKKSSVRLDIGMG